MPAFDPARDTDHLQLVKSAKTSGSVFSSLLFLQLAAVFAWTSGIFGDGKTYWLWTAPVLLGTGLVFATRRTLPLSSLTTALLALLGTFLMTGGAIATQSLSMLSLPYVPSISFAMTQDTLFLVRAFLIGFVGAIASRELLLRKSPLLPGKWLAFLVTTVCLSLFQLLDALSWAANGLLQRGAVEFSAAGPWEFLLVYAGAALSLLTLTRLHDRQVTMLWMDFTKSLNWQLRRSA